jgi:hypothetical protein
MWIGRESGRRWIVFPMLARENACRYLRKGECLIHAILCCEACTPARNVIHAEKFPSRRPFLTSWPDGTGGAWGMIGVDLIGHIRRAYFEQHRSIKGGSSPDRFSEHRDPRCIDSVCHATFFISKAGRSALLTGEAKSCLTKTRAA